MTLTPYICLEKGTYLYFDANKFQGTSGTAALLSSPISANKLVTPFCLLFSYYLSGHLPSSPLNIYTVSKGESKPVIWLSRIADSWRWIDETVQLNVVDQTKVNELLKLHWCCMYIVLTAHVQRSISLSRID